MNKMSTIALNSDNQRQSPNLRNLLAKAELHLTVEQQVIAALPEALRSGVRFVSSYDGDITLSAESSMIASRLRLQQHEIMGKLRENDQFRFVWRFRVKVVPPRFVDQKRPEKQPLSHENAQLLKEEAGHTKDTALREVLEKLASHVRT
ncbi:DciA family protein [Marinobacter caseinilyticus]|uniref:DciA family protein n=1 Tax=Marinobacter caseinilyticus TaxID=2692195 RepID=UPI00140D2554|nr:DciA family protein [Marinobacter caseinilyticus]